MNSVNLKDTRYYTEICYFSIHWYWTIRKKKLRKKKEKNVKIASKRVKNLGIHFQKEVKDLYSENYKNTGDGSADETKNGKIIHVLGLKEYNYNGYTTQSNLEIQCKPYQNTHDFFFPQRYYK